MEDKNKGIVDKKIKATDTKFKPEDFNSKRWTSESDFLKEINLEKDVNLTKEDLEKANISWKELACIYIDHEENFSSLQSLGGMVGQMLQRFPCVNSVKFRVKGPKKLINKIVRKRINDARDLGFHNYKDEVSDLVGVRVLHVLKSDWIHIHKAIVDTFELVSGDNPVAYITNSLEEKWKKIYEEDDRCKKVECRPNYKSIHYDVIVGFTKIKTKIEIQSRTINEEAWGELDHKINYPYKSNPVIENFIRSASLLSENADELGQYIISANEHFDRLEKENKEAIKNIKKLTDQLTLTEEQKKQLENDLSNLRNTFSPFQFPQENMFIAGYPEFPESFITPASLIANPVPPVNNLLVDWTSLNSIPAPAYNTQCVSCGQYKGFTLYPQCEACRLLSSGF